MARWRVRPDRDRCFGLATGIIGRAKGSSFFIWFLVGGVLPLLGLIAAFLYRVENDEPERRCPRCGSVQKLYVQVCRALRRGPLPAGPSRGAAPATLRASAQRSQVRTIAFAKPIP